MIFEQVLQFPSLVVVVVVVECSGSFSVGWVDSYGTVVDVFL